MRFIFDYEVGEEHEEAFEVYFNEFDHLMDVPKDKFSYDDFCVGSQVYKIAKKSLTREDVFWKTVEAFDFKIQPREGLNNDKPVVFFDLETTGVDVCNDRIVQIGITKVYVGGKREKKVRYLKPTIPIPKEASDVHGIDAETVKNAPSFKEVAKSLRSFLAGCDLGGYNILGFDVPLLQEEFIRVGIMDWPEQGTRFLDSMVIYHEFNPRTLEAAYKYYCDKELEGAHDADVDITASIEVLDSQIAIHDIPDTSQGIHEFCTKGRVDFAGHLKRREEDGVIIYARGKRKGSPVVDYKDYAQWMLSKDFPYNTKKCLREILYPAKIEETANEATGD